MEFGMLFLATMLILVMILAAVFYVIVKKIDRVGAMKKDDASLLLIQEQIKDINSHLERSNIRLQDGLSEANKTLQSQFAKSAEIITEVTKKLTELHETNKQVLGFTGKLEGLEHILKNPKQRGILGEYFLEAVLSNVLQPNQYKMQYAFDGGETVDAVIFFNEKIIPIDAKFSLEKYNVLVETAGDSERAGRERDFKSDVKARIDETARYIRPQEGTTDFAFMFVPAEGVYYHLLVSQVGEHSGTPYDLIEYGFKKRVILVSPTSFFAYLQTVLHGLRALTMEASVAEIIKKIGDMDRHLKSYEHYLRKLGAHLAAAVSMYNQAYREFKKIDQDVYKISGNSEDVEVLALEKPMNHEN